jgi:phytoene dehydrogenase-like protein
MGRTCTTHYSPSPTRSAPRRYGGLPRTQNTARGCQSCESRSNDRELFSERTSVLARCVSGRVVIRRPGPRRSLTLQRPQGQQWSLRPCSCRTLRALRASESADGPRLCRYRRSASAPASLTRRASRHSRRGTSDARRAERRLSRAASRPSPVTLVANTGSLGSRVARHAFALAQAFADARMASYVRQQQPVALGRRRSHASVSWNASFPAARSSICTA